MTAMGDRPKSYPIRQIQVLDKETSAAIRPVFGEIDRERARADEATARLNQARDAVRAGDWHGLWQALSVDTEALPEIRAANVWPDLKMAGLAGDQQIRAHALRSAGDVIAVFAVDVGNAQLDRLGEFAAMTAGTMLAVADRFESYIRYGDLDPDDIAGAEPPEGE